MHLPEKRKLQLSQEEQNFINLYAALGERARNFLPEHVFSGLDHFVRLCYEEPDDPMRQKAAIRQHLLALREAIPGYVDVSLMIFPHRRSKAYEYSASRKSFHRRLHRLMDTEIVAPEEKQAIRNILNTHDFSIGTPPVTGETVDFLFRILLGDKVSELRKFRDIIGITDKAAAAQWRYFLDVLEQMVLQSSHYTTGKEIKAFLARTESTVNFKGLNGFIRTLVSGRADTAVKIIREELFNPDNVRVIEYNSPDAVFEELSKDSTSIFVIKCKSVRSNPWHDPQWFPHLARMIFVDNSKESQATNTCLVFAFHNQIVEALDNVHTKKLGAPANTQMNLRLILEKVHTDNITMFREAVDAKIEDYRQELHKIKSRQLKDPGDPSQDTVLYKFDEFTRQIISDKYVLSKFSAYLILIEQILNPVKHSKTNAALMKEFEQRMKDYFYAGSEHIRIKTIVEGGGRNQIRTYGEYLLNKKPHNVNKELIDRCRVILDILPDTYERTLHSHFHKNFGLNIFLEKYREYLTKVENEANNKGRFRNLLIDLGVEAKYQNRNKDEQKIIREFFANLGNLDKTSISDDVQMIIRDTILNPHRPKPFIFLNRQAAWEYQDLFPIEQFDLNPFDIEIELTETGHIDYERFLVKLERIKSSFQLFDETGRLWDAFCANSTILINDPANPSGLTDFNDVALIRFLKFVSATQFTLFLDEAYNDAIKIEDPDEPKWRTISTYIINNMTNYPRISMVASLSTTKNLGATGDRLGALAASPAKKEVIAYAEKNSARDYGNTNSLYFLVNILEVAQLARKIKSELDESLPKDASRHKIKKKLESFIFATVEKNEPAAINQVNEKLTRESLFTGSPLHLFLLNELMSLDKLDVLQLPDDFKYKGEAFFSYYKKHIVSRLNAFRVNRIFRSESKKRMAIARKTAADILTERGEKDIRILEADGAYLFNLVIDHFYSYQDLENFTHRLAEQRGIAVIPYPTGFVRFSLGGYINDNEQGYRFFTGELNNTIRIFLDYWNQFKTLKEAPHSLETDMALEQIFPTVTDRQFIGQVLSDFNEIRQIDKNKPSSLRISTIKTLYHPFPEDSGVSVNSIGDSHNAVFEFYENIGKCANVIDFIRSKAFSKIYENLLPQVYENIPAIRHLDINEVIAKYGKPVLLKYIQNKLQFEPGDAILDGPDELLVMKEILIELEKTLFSDAKIKILALQSNDEDLAGNLARLEGYNAILRKHIREILIHFNLPFENEASQPTLGELFSDASNLFVSITGKSFKDIDLAMLRDQIIGNIGKRDELRAHPEKERIMEVIQAYLNEMCRENPDECLEKLFILHDEAAFSARISDAANRLFGQLVNHREPDTSLFVEKLLPLAIRSEFIPLWTKRQYAVKSSDLHRISRDLVLFLTGAMNLSLHTEYYDRYNHILIKMLILKFSRQNSAVNEMIQHGFTLYGDFTLSPKTRKEINDHDLNWIIDIMKKCGVIGAEQPVQTKTRMQTDAKKREYPYHRIDGPNPDRDAGFQDESPAPRDFIKHMALKPQSEFFVGRLKKFSALLDRDDYRCRVVRRGLVNELYIFHKAYLKYLADNFRLIMPDAITQNDLKDFIPDIILFLGAPEKVISYPAVGYFNLPGPRGNIKTIVTPLKKQADYFGNIKKPRLAMLNEKVKEMGGLPVHGSFFIVEEDDGSLFGVLISGDSGVGKSEMLAAMMLKWLRRNLTGIRSIKLIAGDMLHIFPDEKGNLYGIGTEVGDFSRITDFDPDFIENYFSLFQSSSDSNTDDLNSRSTISGFCDISMPFKIDIMLTAHNFSKQEAGITKYANVENFVLYRDSHGERKEKATSSDNPHFQRTLLRYTGDKKIVEIIDQHGNYLDDVLDWEFDPHDGKHYLASSYKLMDKIDIESIVQKIFEGKPFVYKGKKYRIDEVKFDIIKNRFWAACQTKESAGFSLNLAIDRSMFGNIFDSLASTPAGNPFIDEAEELKMRKQLIQILKGGASGKGKGKEIQCAILSTDLGKKGKEISGPQKAAQDLIKLIYEVRNQKADINKNRNHVKQLIEKHYSWLFRHYRKSLEIERYNFRLFQLSEMRKANLVRLGDQTQKVDINLKGFERLPKNRPYSPLLVTPNINMELNSFSETYEQLMWLPNNREYAEKFYQDHKKLYIATGYNRATVVNNIIVQLLLLHGYIGVEDLSQGKLTEKVNRETIAAAKFAAVRILDENQSNKKEIKDK